MSESIVRSSKVNAEALPQEEVELGQWHWVTDLDENKEWFGCVTHLGSNYVELTTPGDTSQRIHSDEFHNRCRRELRPDLVIGNNIQEKKDEVRRLMQEVAALTSRLGIGHTASLASGDEGQALARLDPNLNVGTYKTALVKAKKEDLPELFRKIEEANRGLSRWMLAEVLPMRAQAGQMKQAIDRIDDRIFSVELYAGLTETVTQIADGNPAGMSEKVRLLQRRCYMDEECLAQYEVGGMSFSGIKDFDKWLARPKNRDRLLPFPRCIVTFQVRRNHKERFATNLIEFFSILEDMKSDEFTFLYIRNGDRLYRLNTELEFGEQLFPDAAHHKFTIGAKLWGSTFAGHVREIITDDRYQGLVEDYEEGLVEDLLKQVKHRFKIRAWKLAQARAKRAGKTFNKSKPFHMPSWRRHPAEEHEPFEPNNIYYDDMQKKVSAELQQYNRIGLILQGLLDRSPVLHPHPPWKIWSAEGFETAIELIYDVSRALPGGTPPDFEAYRKSLNKSLKVGSITVGQRALWRASDSHKKERYQDPGPEGIAKIAEYEPRSKRCIYAWYRGGESYANRDKQIRTKFACPAEQVLNVEAYKPGDFHMFFDDPRTRANYLQWAPLLLEAEEYHAGNRSVSEPPPQIKRESSWEGQRAYRRRREKQQLVGKMVRLKCAVTTKGNKEYAEGSLWLVTGMSHGGLRIAQLTDDGEQTGEHITGMQPYDLTPE